MSSKNLILAFFLIILILAAYKFSSLYYFDRYIYQPGDQVMFITDRVTRVTNFCLRNDPIRFKDINVRDSCWKIYDWR